MFDKLSPSILILLLVLFRPSATQHNNHLIAELLLSWDTSSNCPGTIAVFDHFYWTEDVEFIDELVQDWRRPLTLLQSHNRGLTMDDGDGNWGGGGDYDIDDSKLLCANIIIFSRSAQNLGKIHRQVLIQISFTDTIYFIDVKIIEGNGTFCSYWKNRGGNPRPIGYG